MDLIKAPNTSAEISTFARGRRAHSTAIREVQKAEVVGRGTECENEVAANLADAFAEPRALIAAAISSIEAAFSKDEKLQIEGKGPN
ncbi:hypothetical protein [Steroidobacter sp.]|uniref:hypothetical protein n=1 Tax=Steroidobacter sp. TaxID=1978227 RepID=UPI001A63775A|nr:hypothetical protein [Steroidobacter sp.]MBL8271216.1 hypothetical protein [Steroidobacter sp.]